MTSIPLALQLTAEQAETLWTSPRFFVAVFAGHLHRGGYAVDAQGVHHVTVQSPLNFDECFGWCDVYADKMDIVGRGGLPSRSLTFPPRSAL